MPACHQSPFHQRVLSKQLTNWSLKLQGRTEIPMSALTGVTRKNMFSECGANGPSTNLHRLPPIAEHAKKQVGIKSAPMKYTYSTSSKKNLLFKSSPLQLRNISCNTMQLLVSRIQLDSPHWKPN